MHSLFVVALSSVILAITVGIAVSAQPGHNDPGLIRRLHASQELTTETIKDLTEKEIREHLTWRGDLCARCDTKEKMLRELHDHVMAGTPCSVRIFSETSALLRKQRQGYGLGDNPHGNNPERRRRSREKRNNPNDPLGGLKDILAGHGLEMHTVSGQKETHDFLEQQKKRKEGKPKPNRDL